MCLFEPTKISPLKEDITVYKVLKVPAEYDGIDPEHIVYQSPYNPKDWHLGERYSEDKEEQVESEIKRFSSATVGLIHCFKGLQDALNDKFFHEIDAFHSGEIGDRYVIAEFVIPKDSKYVYSGTFCYCEDCYGSSDVIFKKVLL